MNLLAGFKGASDPRLDRVVRALNASDDWLA